LAVGGIGLDGGEEGRVDAQGVEIVEALGETVERAPFGALKSVGFTW